MSKATQHFTTLRWPLAAFAVGAVLAFALVPIIARTAAIAAPASVFDGFQGHGLQSLAAFLWDLLLVYGIGIALPVVVALLIVFRLAGTQRVAIAACMALGVFVSIYFLYPLVMGQQGISPFDLPWWQQGLVASLLQACAIALGLDRVIGKLASPNRPSPNRPGVQRY